MSIPRELSNSAVRENRSHPSPAAIRAEIEQTRERLGASVEALGAQLNPSNLTQRVKDSVREATIGRVQHMASNTRDRISETGRSLAQTIRDNPLPAAMAAAGIGWLLLSNRGRDERSPTRHYLNGEPDEFAIPDESHGDGRSRGRVRTAAESVADKAHDLGDRAQEATQHVVERAREAGDRVAQKAKQAGERVADRADAAAHRVQERARAATRRVEHQYEESPIGMGAVALALGLAVGLSVPATRKEAELMGDASEKLRDTTREKLADTTEQVERVVERALPEVQHVVKEAAREVREAARDEGLSA